MFHILESSDRIILEFLQQVVDVVVVDLNVRDKYAVVVILIHVHTTQLTYTWAIIITV